MRYRKLYFTLMEMLIALGILLSATAIIGVSVFKALEEQKFKAEISHVVDQFRLAQDLMLMFNLDIIVKIKPEPQDKGIIMFLETKDPLQPSWGQFIKRNPFLMRKVQFLNWEGTPLGEELKLAFTSKGLLMSKGVLRLSATQESNSGWTRDIILQGYPAPIRAQLPVENPFKKDQEERDFIEKLIEVTRQEIKEIQDEPKEEDNKKTGDTP